MQDQDDRDAFAAAVRDVRPLKSDNRVALRPPAPRARKRRLGDDFERLWTETEVIEQAGDEILFHRPTVPSRLLRRLRAGSFSIAAEIDLHGLTSLQAKSALREFIVEAAGQGIGCVRVVHGKGLRSGAQGPILKGMVQLWLSRWDEVLAFASALGRDGGGGALYVLLKRR